MNLVEDQKEDMKSPSTEGLAVDNTVISKMQESLPRQDSFNFNFGGESQAFNLDTAFMVSPLTDKTFSNQGAQELGTLFGKVLKADEQAVKEEFLNGNTEAETFAINELVNERDELVRTWMQEGIENAPTPDDVVRILENGNIELTRPISLLEFRKKYLIETLNPSSDRIPHIDRTLVRDALTAEQVAKAKNRIWENTPWWKAIGDFGELGLTLGLVSEEAQKIQNPLSGALDKLRESAPEKQVEVVEGIIGTWREQETLLLENSNSLLLTSQLDGLEQAIREGALGYLNGEMSDEELNDIFESALNATFFAGEAYLFGKGIKGIMNFLAYRIFPQNNTLDLTSVKLLDPNRPSATNIVKETDDFFVDYVYATRENTSAMEVAAKETPKEFVKSAVAEGVAKAIDKVGLSAEEGATRFLPTPSKETEIGLPSDSLENIENLSSLYLSDYTPREVASKMADDLARKSGGTLKVIDSAAGFIPNDLEDSYGDFKFLFGDGEDGFETEELARSAMTYGLLGVDRKNVVQKNGKWYVETTVTHRYNPSKESKDLGVDLDHDYGFAKDWYLTPLHGLGKDQMTGIYALKMQNRAVAKELEERLSVVFNPHMFKVDTTEVANIVKALEKTDSQGRWFKSKKELADFVGVTPSKADSLWQKYSIVKGVMDDVFKIRNTAFRRELDSQDYKVIRNLEVQGEGHSYGKVVPKDSLEVDTVWDNVSGTRISVKDIPEDAVVVRLRSPIQKDEDMMTGHVVVRPDDIQELPLVVLNRRDGHIDRFYEDAGWLVKVRNTRNVDGVPDTYDSVVNIVKTEKEAREIAKQLKEEGQDVLAPQRARENEDTYSLYGEPSSSSFGYASVHTKQRGDIKKGANGMNAPVATVIESLSRTLSSVERQLDKDIINAYKAKMLNQYREYLNPMAQGKYSSNFADMFDLKSMSSEARSSAKAWHNYIENFSSMQDSAFFRGLDKTIDSWVLKPLGASGKVTPDTQALFDFSQRLTTTMWIVGRPFYQLPQNLFQATYIGLAKGTDGFWAGARIPVLMKSILNPSKKNIEDLAKSLGQSVEEANALVKQIEQSGLWTTVGMSDDFLRMVQRRGLDVSDKFFKNALKTSGKIAKSPLTASAAGQEYILRTLNLMAYLSEYRSLVIKGGRPFNAKTKAEISANAQILTQTQNSVNQFAWQNRKNPVSGFLQFFQHVTRLYLDTVVEPLKVAATGKGLGPKGERISPMAQTWGQAFGVTMAIYGIFGPSGFVGGIGGDVLEDMINQIENPYVRNAVRGAWMNTVFNGIAHALGAEGNLDYISRLNPATVVDQIYESILEPVINLDMDWKMGGASGALLGQIAERAQVINALWGTDLEITDKVWTSLVETSTLIAGLKDADRAYMAYNFGVYASASKLSGYLPVTDYEAWGALFSLAPSSIQDIHEETNYGDRKQERWKTVADFWTREMHRELRSLNAGAGTLDLNLEVARKYSNLLKATVSEVDYDEAIKYLGFTAISLGDYESKNFFGYVEPYLNKETLESQLQELVSASRTAGTEKQKEEMEQAIETLKNTIEINKAIEEE